MNRRHIPQQRQLHESTQKESQTVVSNTRNQLSSTILQLQRQLGNRAVNKLVRSGEINRFLSQPLQRKCDKCTEDEETIHRDMMSESLGQSKSIPKETRQPFEKSYGQDFSNVKIHTGDKADNLARDNQATAFAHNEDIVFDSESYNPGTLMGDYIIGHELAHVAQQRVAGTKQKAPFGNLSVSSTNSRAEKEANSAVLSAMKGQKHTISQKPDAEVQRLPPLALIAGAALLALTMSDHEGGGTTSTEENRKKRKQGKKLAKDELKYALIPFVGSYLMIEQAESDLERGLGYIFFGLDAASIGALGTIARGVWKGVMKTRAAKVAADASAKTTATASAKTASNVSTISKQGAADELGKLSNGAVVVVMERANHMAIYTKFMDKWQKIQGGITKSVAVKNGTAVKESSKPIGELDIHAYSIVSKSGGARIADEATIEAMKAKFYSNRLNTCASGACKMISKSELGVSIPKGKVAQLIPIQVLPNLGTEVKVISEYYLKQQAQSLGQLAFAGGTGYAVGSLVKYSTMGTYRFVNKKRDAKERQEFRKQMNKAVEKAHKNLNASPDSNNAEAIASIALNIRQNLSPHELAHRSDLQDMGEALTKAGVEGAVKEAILQFVLRNSA